MTDISQLQVVRRSGDAPAGPETVLAASGDGWTARFERMTFGPGFRMSMGRFDVAAPTELPAAPIGDRPSAINAFTLVSGKATLDLDGATPLPLSPRRAVLLRTQGPAGRFRLPGPQIVRYFGVSIAPELVLSLFDGLTPADLAPFLAESAAPVLVEKRIGPVVQGLIKKLGNPVRPDTLNRLHREVVALQFLTELLHPEPASSEGPSLSSEEQDILRLSRRRLLEDLREPPAAAVLAEGAGIPLRRFLRGFEAVHGASPAQLLRQERLARGRELLEAGLSLKQIAWEVGYSHANNFVTAFCEHFGAPPRQFQRGRAARSGDRPR